jgi:ATP-dependent RNA helicase DDX24/MAK5
MLVLWSGYDVNLLTIVSEQDDDLAKQIKSLKFLVLDEADRMVEAGHFAELEYILRLTLKRSRFVFVSVTVKG